MGWTSLFYELGRAAIRLRRTPFLLAFAIVVVGAGVGMTAAVFSAVRTILIAPLGFAGSEDVYFVSQKNPRVGEDLNSLSPGSYLQLERSAKSLRPLGAFQPLTFTVGGDGPPITVNAAQITPSFFDVVPVRPILGRLFRSEDAVVPPAEGTILTHAAFALLSEDLWRSRLGGHPDVIGQSILVDGRPHVIIGVLPHGFRLPFGTDLWVPLAFGPAAAGDWGGFYLGVFGRLRPGSSEAQAQAEVNALAAAMRSGHPMVTEGMTFPIMPVKERLVREIRPSLLMLVGVSIALLTLICANLATLLLAQGVAREREFAVRSAIGAPRAAIVRQLVAEAVVLAAVGGITGMLCARVALDIANRMAPEPLRAFWTVRLDLFSLIAAVLVAAATAIGFAIVPALRLVPSRIARGLAESGPGTSGSRRQRRLQRLFVSTQLAFAMVLLTVSGYLIRSYSAMQRADLGFRVDHLLTMDISLPKDRYRRPEAISNFVTSTRKAVAALPSVVGTDVALRLPVLDRNGGIWTRIVNPIPADQSADKREVTFNAVTPSYFRTMGIPIRRGSPFNEAQSGAGDEPVVVVSETFVREHMRGLDPIGSELIFTPWPNVHRRVIAVVADVKQGGYRTPPDAAVYMPFAQVRGFAMSNFHLVLRTATLPATLANAARERVSSEDPTVGIGTVASAELRLREELTPARIGTWLVSILGLLGLWLALSGLHAVTVVEVAQRSREIGIRAAFGAQPDSIVWLLVRDGIVRGVVALLAGLLLAVALMRIATSLLYAVGPTDPLILGAAVLTLSSGTAVAMLIPAWRLARRTPAQCLRIEMPR